MKVRSERTTAAGEEIATVYEGDQLVAPVNSRPKVGGDTVLGTITDITEIGGGIVTLIDGDGETRSFGEVETVRLPPMVDKIRLEFEAIPNQTVDLGRLIGIKSNDETPHS